MASSSIEVPTTGDPAALATDLVAGKHYQATKVFGGGEGVVNELVVLGRGEIRRPAVEVLIGEPTPSIEGLVESTAYAAGDTVGDPCKIEGIENGLYNVRTVVAGLAGIGSLPDGLVAYLIPYASADVPAYGGDSDPFSPADARIFTATPCPLVVEVPTFPGLAVFRPVGERLLSGLPFDPSGAVASGDTFDLQIALLTIDGGAEISAAAGIAIRILLERVGPVPVALV